MIFRVKISHRQTMPIPIPRMNAEAGAAFVLSLPDVSGAVRATADRRAVPKRKGANCSVNGSRYEHCVVQVCHSLYYVVNGAPLCASKRVAGSSKGPDAVLLNVKGEPFHIEIKKFPNPDWGQFGLVDGTSLKELQLKPIQEPRLRAFIQRIFVETVIPHLTQREEWIVVGGVPNLKNIAQTSDEYAKLKSTRFELQDFYISCDDPTTIAAYYREKGCKYIQIAGFGLHHLGEDVEGFGVPEFRVPTRIRVRTKIHSSGKGKNPFKCSWTLAFQPADNILPSPYTLDGTGPIPPILGTTDSI